MRIVSWNVNKRRDCETQVRAVLELAPDIVVLQEVMARAWPRLSAALAEGGLAFGQSGWELATDSDPARRIVSFVAIASRWPLAPSRPAAVPAQEAVACVTVSAPAGRFDVIGVHVPTSGQADRTLMVETQEGLLARLLRAELPTVVCGDYNSPRGEEPDGTVVPFSSLRRERARAAELALVGATNAAGMIDAYRAARGYDEAGHSWYWKNRGTTGGFRLDHVFVSPSFRVVDCDYVHAWRESRLSDHSAIYADIELVGDEVR